MLPKIYLDDPCVGKLEKKYIADAIDLGYVSTFGPLVGKFERSFASRLKVRGATSTQNGTAAIHIALYELGVKPGDEVIVPALTFVATVNPVLYMGAIPVFADVDAKTWNIDPEKLKKSITRKTKAVIPVHLYGNPCNMDAIMDIVAKKGIYVVEDSTESLGATYKNRFTGTFGDIGCFSFNGNKIITTGGGGMVAGNDKSRIEHIKFLVNQARDNRKGYFHPEVGFNYRMTNIEASLGLAQLEQLNGFLSKKRSFTEIYRKELSGVKGISFQESYDGSISSNWLTCIMLDTDMKLPLVQRSLLKEGIPTRRVFMPLFKFPYCKKYRRTEGNNSFRIYERGLCLPSSTLNREEGIRHVCNILKKVVSRG